MFGLRLEFIRKMGTRYSLDSYFIDIINSFNTCLNVVVPFVTSFHTSLHRPPHQAKNMPHSQSFRRQMLLSSPPPPLFISVLTMKMYSFCLHALYGALCRNVIRQSRHIVPPSECCLHPNTERPLESHPLLCILVPFISSISAWRLCCQVL